MAVVLAIEHLCYNQIGWVAGSMRRGGGRSMPLPEMLARKRLAEAEKELREADADFEDMELCLQDAGEVGGAGIVNPQPYTLDHCNVRILPQPEITHRVCLGQTMA